MADLKISQLNTASEIQDSDNIELSQDINGVLTSTKTSIDALSTKVTSGVVNSIATVEVSPSANNYAVGDYLMYNRQLYKVISAITSGQTLVVGTNIQEVAVTDEMGSGGGGTGGHTIIDEDGNSMTARAGLQFVGADVSDDGTNNKTIVDLASAGGIDGVFIDTSNVIVPRTSYATNFTYTATEDCVAIVDYANNPNASAGISVDDKPYSSIYSSSLIQNTATVFLKKGQTLKGTNTFSGADVSYIVYGIQTGTTHSKFQPVIYSLEERVIGVWKDGRPLYQKTVDFGALPNDTTKTVSYNISDLDYFVKIQCVAHNQNGSRNIPFVDDASKNGDVLLDTIKSSGVIRIIANTDLSSLTGEVTLQYVKTTDVAGSGTWTPQGVPTHHYSTDEHIVGTWMGETLWEKTYDFSSNYIAIPAGNSWKTTDIDSSNMGVITSVFANHSDGTMYNDMSADPTGNNHTKLNLRSVAGASVFYLTIQYTKTS